MWVLAIAAGSAALYLAQVAIVRRLTAGQGLVWSLAGMVRTSFGLFFLGLMAAVLGPIGALAVGLAANVFVGGRMVQTTRRSLRLQKLLARVKEPDAEAALAALDYEIEGLRGGRGGTKATYDAGIRQVLWIALNVSQAGHSARALGWLGRIEPEMLAPAVAMVHAQYDAAFRIGVGDLDGARKAIQRAARPAMAPFEEAFLTLEALLEALDGDAARALECSARALAKTEAGPSRTGWQMARAHALARVGAVEEARETLQSIQREVGEPFLRRIVAHNGPASRLAEAVLSERNAYR